MGCCLSIRNKRPPLESETPGAPTNGMQISGVPDSHPGCAGEEEGKEEAARRGDQLQDVPSPPGGATHTSEIEATAITSIQATDVALGPRRIPASFNAMVHDSDIQEWRTENKRSSVSYDVVQWNGPVPMIPQFSLSRQNSLVCNECWQHFYAGPQLLQPFISDSIIEYTTSLDDLQSSIDASCCSMCRLLLHSIQLRQKDGENYLEISSLSEQLLLKVSTGTRTKHVTHILPCLDTWNDVWSEDDPMTAVYIRRRDINLDVGSDASYQLAKTWLQECIQGHEDCPKYKDGPLPTRVLDVTPIGDSQIRLWVPDGKAAPYTALSYCWGGPQPFSTQKSTMEAYLRDIDLHKLPSTIRDAITVTRGLGLRYLWIDAFCIIQDDDLDKRKEIARMGEIYQFSYCTIIAECSERASDGFLHKRTEPPDCPQYRLPYIVPDGVGTMLLRSQDAYHYDPLEEPLNARGWTLQERLLPPRQLIYSAHRLRWKCHTREDTDGGVSFNMYDEPLLYSMSRVLDVASGRIPAPNLDNGIIDPWNPWLFWKRLVMEFSRRLCTDPADRVRAIGGAAKEFERVWGPSSRYLAGHHECFLFESLAWRVNPFKMAPRRGGYRAPSWSWMAAEGEITYDEEPKGSRRAIEILECDVTLTSSFAPYGDLSHGVLKLRGHPRPAQWYPSSQGALHVVLAEDLEFLQDCHNHEVYEMGTFPDSVEDCGEGGRMVSRHQCFEDVRLWFDPS
ncbi:heterokaryon incompatibility protein-domain-containing protein [Boletus coccyginus]|nr:heterokaryon incompatibility protein-domain-containing protein [Boletus coccyginus]